MPRSPLALYCLRSPTCESQNDPTIEGNGPPPPEPGATLVSCLVMVEGLRIVFLDQALAVVDKPAGMVVHPAPSHRGKTLVDELADIFGGGEDPQRPGIVHRLDKGTSGLLVVARNDAVHAALQAQVQRREVERSYLALAAGRIASRTGTIDAPIGRAPRQRHRMAVSGAAARGGTNPFQCA